MAKSIGNEAVRAHALAALAPQLSEALLEEALRAAKSISDEGKRAKALAALAPQLPETQRVAVLEEALQAARSRLPNCATSDDSAWFHVFCI